MVKGDGRVFVFGLFEMHCIWTFIQNNKYIKKIYTRFIFFKLYVVIGRCQVWLNFVVSMFSIGAPILTHKKVEVFVSKLKSRYKFLEFKNSMVHKKLQFCSCKMV